MLIIVFVFLRRKINTIPNGIDIINIKIKSSYNQDSIVFAAARIYEIKGLHLLLKAMSRNDDKRKLIVIGDLNHVKSYKTKIKELSKNLNVTFLGMIKDKKYFLNILKVRINLYFHH